MLDRDQSSPPWHNLLTVIIVRYNELSGDILFWLESGMQVWYGQGSCFGNACCLWPVLTSVRSHVCLCVCARLRAGSALICWRVRGGHMAELLLLQAAMFTNRRWRRGGGGRRAVGGSRTECVLYHGSLYSAASSSLQHLTALSEGRADPLTWMVVNPALLEGKNVLVVQSG